MSLARKSLRGGLIIWSAQIISQACSFLRNVWLARALSPHDMGLAATFTMTISLLEMLSNLNMETLMLQSPAGEKPGFQKTVQAVQVIRGIATALLLALLSPVLVWLFNAPEARWEYIALALYPLIRGFVHLDMFRYQRNLVFGPSLAVEAVSQILILALTGIAVHHMASFRLVLILLMGQSLLYVIGSHLLAQRRYGWGLENASLQEIWHFGWPLLVSGATIFITLQGDQLILGGAGRLFGHQGYSLEILAGYSLAFSLAMTPMIILGRVYSGVVLPLLSQAVSADERQKRYDWSLLQLVTIGLLGAMVMIIYQRLWIGGIFGHAYQNAAPWFAMLTAMQLVRLIRLAPTTICLAVGDSLRCMLANVLRSLGIVGLLVAAALGRDPQVIASMGLLGEVLALIYTNYQVTLRHGLAPGNSLMILALLWIGLFLAIPGWCGTRVDLLNFCGLLAAMGVLVSALLATPTLRRWMFLRLGLLSGPEEVLP